ncbi:hypothetical protein RF11_16143 [Thelohanellus kitauei]|uniref:Uncharacterized protein n=1 Tax=Thelohanellus kitauei TaxID=669202 RepID=A0A0C2MTJ7_THEKT|nr:hypothetical protein RF11_16143 [Thelohanellus kitauei]
MYWFDINFLMQHKEALSGSCCYVPNNNLDLGNVYYYSVYSIVGNLLYTYTFFYQVSKIGMAAKLVSGVCVEVCQQAAVTSLYQQLVLLLGVSFSQTLANERP